MIHGIKSYAEYCKNIDYTNLRFDRELKRLTMVMNMEVLEKARTQIESNQPVTAARATDTPNMEAMFDGLSKMNEVNLRFVPDGMTKEMIDKLEGGIDAADIALVISFDPKKMDVKVKDIAPPPLPVYPEWALTVDRRAKLGLTDGAGGKR